MFINVLDFLTIKIESPPKKHLDYLNSEFQVMNGDSSDITEDIRIVFRDDLIMSKESVIVDAPIGYDSNGSFWFDPNHNIARLNFNEFDKDVLELICSVDFSENFLYFLIIYLLSFKMVSHGGHFIHASVIEYKRKIIMFPAWRHSGKTNLMLKFVERGAKIIADDNVFIFNNGKILPYLKKTHLLYYNIIKFPYLLDIIDPAARNLCDFVKNTEGGKNNFNSLIVDEVRSHIRSRVSNKVLSSANFKYQLKRVDYVIHLNRLAGINSNHIDFEKISKERIVNKISETSKFELSYFYAAYNAHCLCGKNEARYFLDIDEKITSIFYNAFKKIGSLYELSFYDSMNHEECFKLVDDLIE
jgi:hypothetical protein